MKAQNLTICVPSNGPCDKNCNYCVSKMTPQYLVNEDLMRGNIEKIKTLARATNVTSVLLTGDNFEPFLNSEFLYYLIGEFNEYPLEIQTNGISLHKAFIVGDGCISTLNQKGLDIISFSIDNLKSLETYTSLFKAIKYYDMTVRVALNITDMIPLSYSFNDLLIACIEAGVDQLLLRNIVTPKFAHKSTYTDWIYKHTNPQRWTILMRNMEEELIEHGRKLRTTEWNSVIWDLKGISITTSDYCIQSESKDTEVRSIIFQQDGHCYTSWDSKASRIF